MTKLQAALLVIVFSWATLGAEVKDAGPEGFNIGFTLNVNAKPDDVYRKLVDEVQVWWDPNHTFSGDSSNLSIDDRPGGCFCEKLENGGGVRHLTVVNSAPGEMLRMSGGLGPLQALGATGSLTVNLEEAGQGSVLDVSYRVGGYLKEGLGSWAPAVDGVLKGQFERLKRFIETGSPE